VSDVYVSDKIYCYTIENLSFSQKKDILFVIVYLASFRRLLSSLRSQFSLLLLLEVKEYNHVLQMGCTL